MIQILACLRCGHEWPSHQDKPKICPRCKTPYWDVPKRRKSPELIQKAEAGK